MDRQSLINLGLQKLNITLLEIRQESKGTNEKSQRKALFYYYLAYSVGMNCAEIADYCHKNYDYVLKTVTKITTIIDNYKALRNALEESGAEFELFTAF